MLTWPWGVQIGELVTGSAYHSWEAESEERKKLWTTRYGLAVVAQMQKLISVLGDYDFEEITVPTLFVHATVDKTVWIDKIKDAFERWGSSKKRIVELEGSTRHELAGSAIAPKLSPPLASIIADFIQTQFDEKAPSP